MIIYPSHVGSEPGSDTTLRLTRCNQGQPSNNDSTVANGEVISQLQNQVTELKNEVEGLQKRIRIQDEQLQFAETDNQLLRQQVHTAGESVQPDHEAIRDRTLSKLKLGKQSTAGKAIDAFIKELKHGL